MSGVVAVLGAGAGGLSALVDLGQRGWTTRVWNRGRDALSALEAGIEVEGVLGEGKVEPELVSGDLGRVIEGADAVMVCLPALAHQAVAEALAAADINLPVVLNPGHTGGALHFAAVFKRAGRSVPPIAELSTLTYVVRKQGPRRLRIAGIAGSVRAASLPGGGAALDCATELYPRSVRTGDVLATDLANINLVLHPPGAIAGAAWVEATRGAYRFYVEGMTPGVVRVVESLDRERLAVAAAFGHELPPLAEEMALVGTADRTAAANGDTRAAITGGSANASINAPDGLAHRYYREDLPYGLVPFLALAAIARVECPTAEALLEIGNRLLGEDFRSSGLTAERMGVSGCSKAQLKKRLNEGSR